MKRRVRKATGIRVDYVEDYYYILCTSRTVSVPIQNTSSSSYDSTRMNHENG